MISVPTPDILAQTRRSDCLMAVTPYRGGTLASMLRPGVAWPSETPRNFLTEPETWYDFNIVQQNVGNNDDASFFIDFEWNYDGAPGGGGKRLFYSTPQRSRFSIFCYAEGAVYVFTNMLGSSGYLALPIRANGSPLSKGRHTISARTVGTVLYAKLDDEAELNITSVRNTGPAYAAPTTEINVFIYNLWLRNNTTDTLVWSYPTWYEEKRLLTKYNARDDRGVFEAANTGLGWTIKTPLTGTIGTVLEKRDTGWYANSGKFSATTGIYTGTATDKLYLLMVFDHTLTASEISAIERMWP